MTLADLAHDLRRDSGLALRQLARRPGFAAVALLTLALGIGAPTAIFSVVNAVLLRPLPYAEPDRVVRFRMEAETPAGPFKFDALPVSEALDWSAESRTLQALAVFNDRALTLTSSDGPYRLIGISATPNLFDLLGTQPAIGRAFTAADVDPHQVVLSDAMWRRFFNADPAMTSRSIVLDGERYQVTGVMPATRFPTADAMFWVPQQIEAGGSRGMVLPVIARLKPGVTVDAVVQEGRAFVVDATDPRVRQTLIARTLQEQMVGGVRRVLWVLMAAVSLVSVIATVNIALLLLTRGASRSREFSIRLALGASRARLARQLCVESVVLALSGGVLGMAFAGSALKVLMQLAPPNLPRLHETAIDGSALGFGLVITLLASVIFGLFSAGRLVAFDAVRRLMGSAGESRLVVRGPSRRQMNLLAGLELALTTVLLVGAGLLLKSFVALVLVPQGFEPKGAVAFSVNLPLSRYPTPAARAAFLVRLREQLITIPGVQAGGFAAEMPNRQPTGRFDFRAGGIDLSADPMTRPVVDVRMITAGAIEAIGVPLRAGRTFNDGDTAGSEPVMVISEMFAHQQFGDRSAIGEMLYSESGNRRVVGVVGDVRPAEEGAEMKTAAYLPLSQQEDILSWHASMNVIVRSGAPAQLLAPLRSTVLALDSQLAPSNMRLLRDEVSNLVAGPRFSAATLAVFASIALLMASIGVYGVMWSAAGQRTREIGVRVALGATHRQVLWLMMRDGLIVISTGLVAGLLLASWLSRALTGLLYDVTPADPAALGSVGLILVIAGMIAAFVPARRAARLNVVSALRDE